MWLQSVLVTVDRHEWYAPPQIYKRDDSTGLWTAKPALPPQSPLLASNYSFAPPTVLSGGTCESSPTPMENIHQGNNQDLTDGVTYMDTNYESDVGSKKRRVEEESSSDGTVVADSSLHEPTEENLRTTANAILGDYKGSPAAAANASLAERVIEPTLVMFEVLKFCC